jgi:hypothetical protein
MPLGLLGVAAAGAARGAKDVSNRNVEVEREALRNKYATQYEEFKYQRGREDAKEDAAAAGAAAEGKYQREREDKLSDTAADREFKAGESAKDRSLKERLANNVGGKGGASGKESAEGIRSTLGKEMGDLIDRGIAQDAIEALEILDQRGLIKGIAANQFITDPKKVMELYDEVNKARNVSRESRDTGIPVREFVRNPKTGAFEPK